MASTDDVALTRLVFDATGARQGAAEFHDASERILADNRRVEDALARSAATLAAAQGKKAAAHKAAATAANEGSVAEIAATRKSADAIAEAARRGDSFSSRLGNVSIGDVRSAQRGMARLPATQIARSYEERIAALEAGMVGRSAPRFAASLQGPAAAITPAALGPLVSSAFGTIRAGDPQVARGVRNVALTEATDPIAIRALGQIHNAAATSAAAAVAARTTPGLIGAVAPAIGSEALTGAIVKLSLAVDKLSLQIAAAPTAARQAAAAARPLAPASTATTAARADSPWLVEPVLPRGMAATQRRIQRQFALAEQAAYGATTVTAAARISPATIRSLGTGEAIFSGALARLPAVANTGIPTAAGINVAAWLQEHKPANAVDPAEWNKIRQGSEQARQGTDSLWVSLQKLILGAHAGTADLHGAAVAAEGLGTASGRAAHLAGEAEEGIRGQARRVHENVRFLEAAASGGLDPLEALKYSIFGVGRELGLFRVLLSPVGIGLSALAGGMYLLASRSNETDANLKSFDATLRVMGTGGLASAEGLQQIVENLHHLGLSAEDAKKAVDAVSRTPGLSPGAYTQIATLGTRVAQYAGGDAATRIEGLTKATRGGVEGLIQYGEAFNAFSVEEINSLRALDRAGLSQEAVSRALDKLDQQIPETKDLFTDLHNSIQALKNSWDDLVTSLSKSPAVTGTVNAITSVLQAASGPTGVNATVGALEGAAALALTRGTRLGFASRTAIGAGIGGVVGTAGSPLLSNVATGAGLGATVGSFVPVPGATLVGAGLGAATGAAVTAASPANTDAVSEVLRKGLEASEPRMIDLTEAQKAQTAASHDNTEALNKLTSVLPATARSEASTRSPAEQMGLPALPGGEVAQRLIGALIQAESRGVPNAESPKGALGLTQVMLGTANEIQAARGQPPLTREQLLNPEINVPIGTEYLRQLTAQFGNIRAGLEAYNAGPERYRQFATGQRPLPEGTPGYAQGILRAAGLTGTETAAQIGFGASSPVVAATPTQTAESAQRQEENRRELEALAHPPGFAANRELEANRLRQQAEQKFPGQPNLQDQYRLDELAKYDAAQALINQHEETALQRHIRQAKEIGDADLHSIEAGLQARAHAAAEEAQIQKGGPGIAARTQDQLTLEARQAITGGQQQLKAAETRIVGEREIAQASLTSRAATIQATIATEAYAFAENAVHAAGASRVKGLDEETAAIARNKAEQLLSLEVSRETKEAGEAILSNRNQAETLGVQIAGQGQGSIEIQRQIGYLRIRQELADRYSQAPEPVRNQFVEGASAVVELNAHLEEAQLQTARLNEAFSNIATTISGDLTNSIRNALIRTPAEAGEHLKHYWDEFRAGLKQFAGEALSTFANLAFLKPLTGTVAGALGLGQTAQQLGTFGGLFQGGPGATGLSGANLALSVNSISNNSGLFNATQGGYNFPPGTNVTVQGGDRAIAGTGQAAAAPTGTEGLSADALAALKALAPTPAAATVGSNAPSLDTFRSTVASAAARGTQESLAAAATAAGAPSVFLIPGTETPISGASSLAPAEALPAAAALATGVTPPSTTSPTAAATQGLVTPGNIGGAVSGLTALGSLLSQPGLLPSWLSGVGGAGGLFGAGGITNAINSFGASTGLFASSGIGTGANALSGADLAELGVPGSSAGLFGSSATLTSALTGVAAGFGAGSLLNSVLGGNQLTGNIGAGAGSLVGSLIGTIVGPIGTLLGGIVGGSAGGGIGGLFGAPPSGQSAGVTIGAGGAQTFEQAGGSAANIQASNQVAGQISSFVQQLGQLTDAQGKAIGTIDSGLIAVQSNNRQGLVVSGGNIAGGQFGQNAQNAVVQTELQIIQSLTNVGTTLQTIFAHITDPSQLSAAVQFDGVYEKLNVTSQQLTASLTGNTNQIGPFSQALTQINSTFTQLTAQAAQFGVSAAPISAALNAVTQTLHQDFAINIAEALSTAIAGGNDFIAALIKIHQQFVQNTNDAQALATGVPTGSTPGFAGGTMGGVTPPGWILVGERGPEWMLQPGGATVLPNGEQPPDAPDPLGRSFAQGIGVGDVAGQAPGIGSVISQAAGGPSLLDAAGGALGISSDTLSAIGDALPIAGPILGGLLGAATGHPVQGVIGAASSLLGFAVGGPIGGVIGGLVGLIGNAFGPPPSNRASGDLIDLASGAITDFQSAGDSKADQIVQGISSGIAASSQLLQQVTGGSISGAVSVQDGARDGIKTSYSGPQGNIDAKWGSADEAIGQWALAIAHNLVGIDPGLQSALAAVSDPTQLIPVINAYVAAHTAAAPAPTAAVVSTPAPADSGQSHEYASLPVPQELSDTYSREIQGIAGGAVTLPEIQDLAAGITADAVSQAQLADIQTLLPSLAQTAPDAANILSAAIPSYAAGTGNGTTPPGWILVGEKGPEWISQPGGATVLPNGVMPPAGVSSAGRSFAAGSVSTDVTGAITGAEVAQAGPILAALGIDQLTTVIQNLAIVAPEIAQMAQDLVTSGNALPDILTQGIQALTDPLDLAIEKEKAAGQERVAIATQTGEDLIKVEQLNSANIVSAVVSNLSNQSALAALQYPGNTKALETIQAAPVLAGLSGDQLTALISDISGVAPDLAALAQQQITGGTALPDTVTQALQAIVNPLQLAIEQQGAQATGRTQVATATGLYGPQTAALNTASISQAIVQQIGNQQALLALTANGNPQGLAALQAAPALAGLGIDQLQKVATDLGNAAPQFTAMINALIQSGKALPDALSQASESITQSGLLAVQKAQALAFEQYQAAQASGQNLPEAQQLGAAEQAQAIAQATGTQIPVFGLPDFGTQLEEAVVNPLQLAVQKAEALGQQEIQIAQQTGTDLVQVQRATSESIQQIWYQATSSLTDLKNQITGGTLSGLIPADQVTASITQFNTLLKLVQGGNTNFLSQLSSAGQAAVTASQQAYGQGPQTASVRQQVLDSIAPFLVSATGYPTTGPTALDTTAASLTATGSMTDLQANTTALGALTDALTGVTTAVTTGTTAAGVFGAAASATNLTAAGSPAGITTNPVTGGAFTGSGITAITPNFPVFPSATTLSNALSDTISGIGSGADYTAINEAVQAGIINAAEMPQYASAITAASQYAARQIVSPSQPLAQALSDALTGTPTLAEWGTIITAVNAGLINPVSDPQYATVIQRARIVANAQATSLSQNPNPATAFATTYQGLPAFAAGVASTPPGPILVGEKGPEIIYQPGGMTVLPHGVMLDLASMPAFSDGTLPALAFELPSQRSSDSALAPGNERLFRALLMQVQAGNKQAMDDAHVTNAHLNEIRQGVRPGIAAPERRAVG